MPDFPLSTAFAMQTLTEIRDILSQSSLSPRRRFGQCFLHDQNLMSKLLELADIVPEQPVLEVGPGTGSLTEELLARASKVVAVEIDHGLSRVLARRFAGQENFHLLSQDALESKHRLNRRMCDMVAPRAQLVSNLPYNVATPLVLQMLVQSWAAQVGQQADQTQFFRLTFTVQREMADRLVAQPGQKSYGPVSVFVSLLSRVKLGPTLAPGAFWPKPKVDSRMVRLDYDARSAAGVGDLHLLQSIVSGLFSQRRKQVGKLSRRMAKSQEALSGLAQALESVGLDPTHRPEEIAPEAYLALAQALVGQKEDRGEPGGATQ